MAAGDTLQGHRHHGNVFDAEPGGYWPVIRDGKQIWMVCLPNGSIGDLSQHEITEHEDSTITVSPSILNRNGPGMADEWHGYLERGVWREV